MRLTILTNGSRGDVQPYVALGIGLMKAGYSVQLAVPETLKAFVEPYGLPFVPAGIDTNIMLRDDQLRGLLAAVGHNPMLRIGKLVELAHKAEEFALRLVTDAARVCKDSDAVLCAANHYYAGEGDHREVRRQAFLPELTACDANTLPSKRRVRPITALARGHGSARL